VVAAGLVLLTGGAVAAVTAWPEGDGTRAAAQAALPPATAPVERGDLQQASQVRGTLGFAAEQRISTGRAGVLTWLPRQGEQVQRDKVLYEVDGGPVRLWFGSRPMYRELRRGMRGQDVRQLKENLIALGYGVGLALDDRFTAGTERGVRAWQRVHGLRRTGVVGPELIAFTAGGVRVQRMETAVGDHLAAGAVVMTVTGSDRQVRFDVDADQAVQVKAGTKVTVDLPGGKSVRGRVSSLGPEADEEGGQGGQEPSGGPKVTVNVEVSGSDRIEAMDQAPVTVRLKGDLRRNVLHVPIGALLAGPSSGFLVEVVERGRVRQVPVEVGLFAEGRVEVEGAGLRAGTRVGVPR
jgi:peptidoglycan hydrolase-like protein with peptidoglycan-binding domain